MGSGQDLIIIGAYMCVLIAVGFVFGRIVSTGGDYFRAGGRGSWWLVGSSMFMGSISAYTFVGNAAGIYQSGWSPLAIYLGSIASALISGLFLAAWYRQMRVITPAEILRERFGKTAEQAVSYLIVFNAYVWSGVILYTLAVFTRSLVPNIPVQALIVGVGGVVILYCLFGGNWAVMANGFVQGLVLVSVTAIITTLCLIKTGGLGGFFDAVRQSDAATQFKLFTPPPEGQTIWSAKFSSAWVIVYFFIHFITQSSLFQGVRYFSAKDGYEAQKSSFFAAILYSVGVLLFFIPSMYARIFLSDQVMVMHESPAKAMEYAYAVASYHLLPKGTFSIMLIAVFAAAISSLDTGINRNAALIVRDLLPPIRRKLRLAEASDTQEVSLGRIATLFSGIIVIGIALVYSALEKMSIFDMVIEITGRLILPQMIPLFLFLFIRKVPGWSIFSSIAGGFLPTVVEKIFGLELSFQIVGILVLACGTAGFLIAYPFWNRVSAEEKESVAAFYRRMHRKVDFEKEVGNANDSFQLIRIGWFAVLLGGLSLILLIPLNTFGARCVILIISVFVGGIGGLMIIFGKRIERLAIRQEPNWRIN